MFAKNTYKAPQIAMKQVGGKHILKGINGASI
jgi:hypothetical protein